jgi:hypothetical protein
MHRSDETALTTILFAQQLGFGGRRSMASALCTASREDLHTHYAYYDSAGVYFLGLLASTKDQIKPAQA